jgi:hypothetical protein
MERRHNFQNFAWFNDLRLRKLLDLDPPYQRRSVWNQRFKDYFVETALLNYPAPAIFLYEDMSPEGRSVHHVVDGKQRLTTLFEFVDSEFPVSESHTKWGGWYFRTLPDDAKKQIWSYQFLVEYVPSNDETVIEGIFDRINRNVAKLTSQELRHARLDGAFITASEELAEWMFETFPTNFPRMATQSRKQMKDIELVATLLLLIETGTRNYSQVELDAAFSERDDEWETKSSVEREFRAVVPYIKSVIDGDPDLLTSRLRNQGDFYSLFGACLELLRQDAAPEPAVAATRLHKFLADLERVDDADADADLKNYAQAVRSAATDKGARDTRIRVITAVLTHAS